MSSRSTILILFFIAMLLTGCKTTTYVVMNEYKDKVLSSKHIAITNFTPIILNKDDVIDDLGEGVAEDVFLKYFEQSFPNNVKRYSRIDSISFLSTKELGSLIPRELKINTRESIKINLPEDGCIFLEKKADKPEFILFLGQYLIGRNAGSPGSPGTWSVGGPGRAPTYTPGGGGSFSTLSQQLEFALWDNTAGKLVSCGRIDAESSIIINMTKNNWDRCLDGLSRDIMRATPFYSWDGQAMKPLSNYFPK